MSQSIGQIAHADEGAKDELRKLVEALQQAPPDKAEEAQCAIISAPFTF